VTLTASNAGGTSSASKSVTVKPVAPVASFTFSPSATTTGKQVTFRDTSAFSPTGWSWYFGDGYSSTSQSPTHIYPSAGSFTVYLTARNAQGSNTTSSTVTISQAPGSFDGSILLGSPEATSIKANVFSADESGSAWISYGTSSGTYTNQTTAATLSAGVPMVITLSQLTANTRYYYRLNFQAAGGSSVVATQEYTFHTARPAGSTFTFTIQADSHLDENSILDLYHRTLGNISAEQPDFHIDLGDTFMCEKNCTPFTGVEQEPTSQAQVTTRYIYERGNYGIITPSVPLFLTNGNHDGEAGWLANGTAQSIPVWTTLSRQTYFLNPVPDSFYGGDSTSYPFVGQRAAWYSWQWGDALFIVLDPFWNTTGTVTNGWNLTLGATQFNWLQQTLASSSAKFKFVFIHDLVGGLQGQMRGGVEAAPFYEWGGENSDGTAGFSQNRPGWSMPIDQLFTTYGVTALFHGHDHLYDHQVLNGVAYQEVPQPSADDYQSGPALAADYGYVSGTILSSSGHMLVTVSPTGVTIQYVRAWLPIWETVGQINGQVADTWSVAAP
jgi:PKD repeat protein